ncbi:retroviral-like aspartic protease family protein [Sphingomonas sp. 28-63-12]|uniref:retroviral-like aspartic protease family protein n=1 Tax=Sphingomonas sp. 28-63-12 TaxID=1970434 RepID=UPI000BCF2E86|nr:MAG: hypothetical protein B7Y47_08780 [Sphingomonas sp. 28-63-12]
MNGLVASIALVLLPVGTVPGQDVPVVVDPETVPVTEADVLTLGSDIPGRLTVAVTIGGAGPYPFTIDTGAERTVISRELARLLGLAHGRTVRVTAMTGLTTVNTAIIPSLRVSTIDTDRIEAPIFNGYDLGAPGLLGLDSLKGRAVKIDFDTKQMTVRAAGRRARRDADLPGEIVIRAKSLFGQLVVTDASFRGQQVRVVLDTGSAVTVGNLALRRKISTPAAGLQAIALTSVTGDSLAADYTQIGQVRLGTVTFDNLPVAFADAAPFARFGLIRRPALLLGMDALRQFRRVDIDFANREVRLALPAPPR